MAAPAGAHDVLNVAASQWRGSPDHVLWRIAADEGRIIITLDVGFVPAQSPPLPPGAILLRPLHWYGRDAVVRMVQAALADVPPDALLGYLTVVQPGRVRQRALSSAAGSSLGPADWQQPRPGLTTRALPTHPLTLGSING